MGAMFVHFHVCLPPSLHFNGLELTDTENRSTIIISAFGLYLVHLFQKDYAEHFATSNLFYVQ